MMSPSSVTLLIESSSHVALFTSTETKMFNIMAIRAVITFLRILTLPRIGLPTTTALLDRAGVSWSGSAPLRSTQAVAVHQDGIGGRGHPVGRRRSRTKQNSALCVAGTDRSLGGRVHAALIQGVVLSEN